MPKLGALLLFLFSMPLLASGLDAERLAAVPASLRPWIPWAMRATPDYACPSQEPSGTKDCAWLYSLDLDVRSDGARFNLAATLYAPAWVYLPGDSSLWPLELEQAAVEREGRPALWLGAGKHEIKGFLPWKVRPRALSIPPTVAALRLRLDGQAVSHPALDEQGRLWLGAQAPGTEASGGELRIRVYRRLSDQVPALLTTRLYLDVSGPERELRLDSLLPAGSRPLALHSALPARFDAQGRLLLQAGAGQWTLELESRFAGPLREVRLPSRSAPLPREEIWSFAAEPSLRTVTVQGVPQVDGEQAQVPAEWMSLPSYRMQAGMQLSLEELHRGASSVDSAKLSLSRSLYPDFDGTGATVVDEVQATLRFPQRLSLLAPLQLGSLELDGKPMLVSTVAQGERGLEVPLGEHGLLAVSRLEEASSKWSSPGWNRDFSSARWNVYIPPGFMLLHASGAEEAQGTWISQWTLWAIFLVLLGAAGCARLLGKRLGVLALATLLISYHLPYSPVFALLNVLLALLLLRRLPPGGKPARFVGFYSALSALVALFLLFSFALTQFRTALYPALEHADLSWVEDEVTVDEIMYEESSGDLAATMRLGKDKSLRAKISYEPPETEISPVDGIPQTGPGKPEWHWDEATLRWSGPLDIGQDVRLYWLPPWLGRLLRVLTVLAWCALGLSLWRKSPWRLPSWPPGSKAPLILLLVLGLGLPARAQTPSPEVLEELRSYLVAPPACAGSCVNLAQATVLASPRQLSLVLEAEAQAPSVLPLPNGNWTLQEGSCSSCALGRDSQGKLRAALPKGRTRITLTTLPQGDVYDLAFPMAPRHLRTQLQGWTQSPASGHSLRLMRISQAKAPSLDSLPEGIAPFLQVKRVLRLDRQWTVQTTVTKLAPSGGSQAAEIPLLPGETILSALPVQQGRVRVSLGDEPVSWTSRLPISQTLALRAPGDSLWTEEWLIQSSPRWQLSYEGIPRLEGDRWLPWPGESLRVSIRVPHPVPGASYTLEKARLDLTPGLTSQSCQLELQVISSQGGELPLALPSEALVEQISTDSLPLPAVRDAQGHLRLPLHPGTQLLRVSWKSPSPSWGLWRTPHVGVPGLVGDITLQVHMPRHLWTWAMGGPRLGPAPLFWGMLLTLLLLAVLLRHLPTPLKAKDWALLFLGTSTASVWGALPFVAWMALLAWRSRRAPASYSARRWNVLQLALAFLGLVALISLFSMIPASLLGSPDMGVTGNDSSDSLLRWYQDRSLHALPEAWVFALPLWAYKASMLAWALWLVWSLSRWGGWAWQSYSAGSLWKTEPRRITPPLPPEPKA